MKEINTALAGNGTKRGFNCVHIFADSQREW